MNDFKYDLTINMIVKNESKTIIPTLEHIKKYINNRDNIELVIVDSYSEDDTIKICKQYTDKIYKRRFDTFCNQRNFAIEKSNGRMIFSIDADETMNEGLQNKLNLIQLEEVYDKLSDIIIVPRINIVEGITEEDLIRWNWMVDKNGYINYPDYQTRIHKNVSGLKWRNAVHEVLDIINFTYSYLPQDLKEKNQLIHKKTIQKQTKQNDFYKNNFNL